MSHQLGSKNPNWKGGRYITSTGYVRVLKKDHKFADHDGHILEHRLIWEKYNKACLLPWILVHHKNENKQDNRVENLEPISRNEHCRIHRIKSGVELN